MALEPIQLDDLEWSDLTTAARDRIPVVSNRQWTLHAPVDPGITLLELFASQFDERLYLIDQPNDSVRRAMLKLLGLRPRGVRVATTVLALSGSGKTVVLPAGNTMHVDNSDRDIVFTTAEEVSVLPVQPLEGDSASPAAASRPRLDLIVGGQDRTNELRSGRPTCLLAATGHVRETDIVLWLRTKKLPKKSFCSLLFQLDTSSRIEPQWVADFRADELGDEEQTSEVEPPARIRWFYSSHKGDSFTEFDPSLIQDGTGGLRRSGIVRLPMPPDPRWAPTGKKSERGEDIYSFKIRLRAENPSFTFVPRVRTIVPNAVIARHIAPVLLSTKSAADKASQDHEASQDVARQIFNWRPLPDNELILPDVDPPYLPISRTELDTNEHCVVADDKQQERPQRLSRPVRLTLRERDGEHTWLAVDDLTQTGSGDRRFVVDREHASLRFGDGLQGRLPVPVRCVADPASMRPGEEPVSFTLEYDVGGGPQGNFAARRVWRASGPPITALNVVPAEGGAEPESLEAAVQRAETELQRRYRAVTEDDIASLAVATPDAGIRRAHVATGFLREYPCTPIAGAATVFVVPDLPASFMSFPGQECGEDLVALQPDAGALAAVRRRLNQRRLVTQELQVRGPDYAEVELEIDITGEPFDAQALRATVSDRLHRFLHPLFGGAEGQGWPFGGRLRPSELTRVVQSEIGGDFAVTRAGIRLLQPGVAPTQDATGRCRVPAGKAIVVSCPPKPTRSANESAAESCDSVVIAPHQLVALRRVVVQITRAEVATGGLL